MDWRALLRNKWVWVGAAAAGGLGLFVYLRNRRSSAGAAPAGGSSTVAASPGYVATGMGGFDSTGTDVAAYLGNIQGFIGNQFTDLEGNIQQQLAGIGTQGTTGTASGGGVTVPPHTPTYRSTGNKAQTFSQAAQGAGISVPALLALNPGLKSKPSIGPHTTFVVG